MGLLNYLTNIFHPNSSYIFPSDYFEETAQRAYMKRLAIDEVINFIARAASQTEFRVIENHKSVKKEIYYHLNVRPNTDKSATNFWEEVIYKLLRNGEVLIVQSDTNDLLIADSFVRDEKALWPDTFRGVTVGTYQYQRRFSMDDVIYLTYGNEKLDRYVNGLWNDYGELIGRMYNLQLRNNQIRARVKTNITVGSQEDRQQALQKYIDKIYDSFEKKSISVVPETNGFEYDELNNGTGKNQSFDEINSVKNAFIDDGDRIIMTKNYTTNLKGGEEDDSKD